MNKQPGFDLVERARALQPLIAREADEIERTRRLTPAVTEALIENGLYRSLLPKSLGGAEAPLEMFMQMQEEIAKADASTTWCLGQCSVCAMTAAYLDPDAANEIFNVAPGILAWGAIKHEVQVVPGGYRATARWEFASASRAPCSMPLSSSRAARPRRASRRCAKTTPCRARLDAPKPACVPRAPISMPPPPRSGAIFRAASPSPRNIASRFASPRPGPF